MSGRRVAAAGAPRPELSGEEAADVIDELPELYLLQVGQRSLAPDRYYQ
jgi:hypothetical protein